MHVCPRTLFSLRSTCLSLSFTPVLSLSFISGWKNWAELNGCTGEPVTLSENPSSFIPFINTAQHDDHQWIKAYTDCDGGVEVVQYLNSRTHSGEWIVGTNGVQNQETYSERIIDFLFQWKLLDTDDFTATRRSLVDNSSDPAESNVIDHGDPVGARLNNNND